MYRRLFGPRLFGAIVIVLLTGCGTAQTGPAAPFAQVIDVTDGDTIVIRSGASSDIVRLIGIDTPEIAHHGQPGECFGPEAAARTTELLPPGTVIRLERDTEPRDRYGRLLAYVYGPDGRLVNDQLAGEGFADILSIAPNLGLADHIAASVEQARSDRLGLWELCEQGGPAD